jgi:hypothetical protein
MMYPKGGRDAWATWKINIINRKYNSSYTKQYSNPYGLVEFSCEGQPSIPTSKSSSAVNPRLSDPF